MGIKASAQYTIAEIHEECNVVISNESHVFRADKNNTAVASNTSIQIYGYQGSTQMVTTVGTISGLPSAGMTATISNNGKTNTTITVAVTTALTSSIANNGTLTIPVTVAGKTFNKTFSWSKAQTGATGATGGAGKDGTSITISSTKTEYQVGTSPTTKPTGTWQPTIQQAAQGQYLWTKTTVVYSDNSKTETYTVAYQGNDGADGAKGDKGDTGAAGKDGKDGTGVTITSKVIEYEVTTSGTTIPTSGWDTTFPTSIPQGQYLWTKTTVNYSDGNKTESYTVSYQAKNGTNGTNGTTARTYWITSSVNTITRSMKGTLTPGTITFGSYYRDGTSATSTAYAGRFIIQESTNGSTWTTKYTSSANESSKVYTPTATTNLVKCAMYAAGGTTNKLDELTIGVVNSIDNLEVGGRNLWLNSSFNYGTNGYQLVANSGTISLHSETFNGNNVLEIKRTGFTSTTVNRAYVTSTKPPTINAFKKGETFTLSAYVYIDSTIPLDASNNNIMVRGSLGDAPQIAISQNDATDKWVLYKNTWTATADGTFSQCFVLLGLNGAIRVSQIMLEKANTNSNWTAAPEDLEQEVANKAGKDEVTDIVNSNMNSVKQELNESIDGKIQESTASIEDRTNTIASNMNATRVELDENGEILRKLENYATQFMVSADKMEYDITKGKGRNLVKNSVMINSDYGGSAATGTHANYWSGLVNSKITEDYIPYLFSQSNVNARTMTDSGNQITFDFTGNTAQKNAMLISNKFDLKQNSNNVMLSYKIKSEQAINGTFFIGLVFYDDKQGNEGSAVEDKDCVDMGTINSTVGITNAHHISIAEYTASSLFNNYEAQRINKKLPITRSSTDTFSEQETLKITKNYQVETDEYGVEIKTLIEQYATATYTPVNDSLKVIYYEDGRAASAAVDGKKIALPLDITGELVTVTYQRSANAFNEVDSPTSAKVKALVNGDSLTADELVEHKQRINIYYNKSNNKIWVYNPFNGNYIESTNSYLSTATNTDINSVRVIMGVYGSSALTGSVSITDLKVEYDTVSEVWSCHQNEIYGKKYLMDEYGFSISTDDNMMFIDEDEIAAYKKKNEKEWDTENPVFQIKGEETILRKTVVYGEFQIENDNQTADDAFITKQQKVGSKWFYIFY